MNIQTERLENHTARLTVALEPAVFEQAKQKAARKLSGKVNLPGFRKGKAPYHIVVRYIGEAAIIEEAIELLSNDLYPAALTESGLDPYGPGSVDDFTADPLAIVYSVPLVPTVDLKDYRSVRLPFTTPEVSDRDVERAIKRLRERNADVEAVDTTAELGNYVTLDIHSHVHEEGEDAHGGEEFIHQHALKIVLDENDDLIPGFSAQIVGAKSGDKRDFLLPIPDNDPDYARLAGKSAHFEVTVTEVATIALPELDDAFADSILNPPEIEDDEFEDLDDIEDELEELEDIDDELAIVDILDEVAAEIVDEAVVAADSGEATTETPAPAETAEASEPVASEAERAPATVAELRLKIREDLVRRSADEMREQYAANMLQAIVEQADVRYPEALITDQVEFMLERLDQQLREQRMNLEDYKRLLNKTDEQLFNDYRDPAIETIRRSLVRRDLFEIEQLEPTEADLDAEIDRLIEPENAEQREAIRGLFKSQGMFDYMREQLSDRKLRDRLVAIGTGEAPDLSSPAADEAAETTTATEEETA